MFLWNILLAFAWVMLFGKFTLVNLMLGFILGYLALLLLVAGGVVQQQSYVIKLPKVVSFAGFFIWELTLANLKIAHDVLTPTHHMVPGVIGIPLEARTDAEITLLANLISLTPGTLSLDVSSDRKTLYIHAMYIDEGDIEEQRRKLKDGFERRLLEIMR